MIVTLNGSFGAGKTTVARELLALLSGATTPRALRQAVARADMPRHPRLLRREQRRIRHAHPRVAPLLPRRSARHDPGATGGARRRARLLIAAQGGEERHAGRRPTLPGPHPYRQCAPGDGRGADRSAGAHEHSLTALDRATDRKPSRPRRPLMERRARRHDDLPVLLGPDPYAAECCAEAPSEFG